MSDKRAADLARHFADNPDELFEPGELARLAAKAAEPVQGETLAQYAERWLAHRKAAGLASVRDDRGRLTKWVLPALGPRPMVSITRRDLEELVERLDLAANGRLDDKGRVLVAPSISWKTAVHVWSTVAKLFDDATHGKVLALRVLELDPSDKVRGPDRGGHRAKCYLHPSELLAAASLESAPLGLRRAVVLAVYCGLRAGELRALRWSDIDLDRGVMVVHRAEGRDGADGATKTDRTRRFGIEPAALALLRVMRDEVVGDGRVVAMPPSRKHLAGELRELLQAAGCTRPELYARSRTQRPINWHNLRDSTATWMAVRGDAAVQIQHRLGHTTFTMTQTYIQEAEAIRSGYGQVFPALPKCLFAGAVPSIIAQDSAHEPANLSEPQSGRRDLKARVAAQSTAIRNDAQSGPVPTDATGDDKCPNAGAARERCAESDRPSDVTAALAVALERASAAGQWEVVAMLAAELQARRLAHAGVPSLPTPRRSVR